MNWVARVVVVGFVALATYFLAFRLPLAFIRWNGYDVVTPFIASICAIAVGGFVWKALRSRSAAGILPTTALWAVVVGELDS